MISFAGSLYTDQDRRFVQANPGPKCLQRLSVAMNYCMQDIQFVNLNVLKVLASSLV